MRHVDERLFECVRTSHLRGDHFACVVLGPTQNRSATGCARGMNYAVELAEFGQCATD